MRNHADVDATVHWHGLRLDNRYDGVPYETQAPIPLGGEFTYRVRFPDPGLYWYHPHIREDYGLDMGLYGNLVVVPAEKDHWPPVNREVVVIVDDILIEEARSRRSITPAPPTWPWVASATSCSRAGRRTCGSKPVSARSCAST